MNIGPPYRWPLLITDTMKPIRRVICTAVWICYLSLVSASIWKFKEYRMGDYCQNVLNIHMETDNVLGGTLSYGSNVDCQVSIIAPESFGKLLFYYKHFGLACPLNFLRTYDGPTKQNIDLCEMTEPSPVYRTTTNNLTIKFDGTTGTSGVYFVLSFSAYTDDACTDESMFPCLGGGCVSKRLTEELCDTVPNWSRCLTDSAYTLTCPDKQVTTTAISPVWTIGPSNEESNSASLVASVVLVPIVCVSIVIGIVCFCRYKNGQRRRQAQQRQSPFGPSFISTTAAIPSAPSAPETEANTEYNPGEIHNTQFPTLPTNTTIQDDSPPSYEAVISDQEKFHVKNSQMLI